MNATAQNGILFGKVRDRHKERIVRKKSTWFTPIVEGLKAMKGFLAILTTILTIAVAGYFVSEKLNTFATKSEMSEVVKKQDLIPIFTTINILESGQKSLSANVDKMYDLLLSIKFNEQPKKK